MTVSQKRLAAKSRELHGMVDQLLTIVADGVQHNTPIHEIESKTFDTLLQAGRATVQLLIDVLGDGDRGEQHETPDGKTLQRSSQPQDRPYVSIFGPLHIQRYVYAQRDGQKFEFAEVDARLALPEGKFSYLLQDWDQNFAMEQPFAKVSQTIEKILGLGQHVDSLERMNRGLARSVEAYHAIQTPPPPEEEGEIFVQTADGKGVPIRRPADAPPIEDHQHRSGPKRDRKKMATVGAVYSVDPFIRTPEEVVESLFRDPHVERPKRKRPRPCHKRMRALLNHTDAEGDEIHGRPAVFGWMADELAGRHRQSNKPIVNIMDGESDLWEMRDVFQEDVPMVDVLDLLHVTPRLWDAASLFYARGSRAAKTFVRQRVLRILQGEVDGVIRGLRRMGTTHRLKAKRRKELQKLCRYFENNRRRMRYDEYLQAGYPIASGVIEGACRHVVKDRLERTGMTWVREGAQAMLELRCIYLTGEWESYVAYRVKRETQRLYPYRHTLPTLTWYVAA
jgi:hypothetical protein